MTGADATAPVGIYFMPVTDAKTTKNRLHLDLRPDPGEQEAEIEWILALGARRVDIGQTGAESWTVLADPEGNEFFTDYRQVAANREPSPASWSDRDRRC